MGTEDDPLDGVDPVGCGGTKTVTVSVEVL